MKKHQLSEEQISELLESAEVGRISTHNPNGYPYTLPVHYVVIGGNIFVHGLVKGQKLSNIAANNKVCFEVERMGRIVPDDKSPCDTNTEFDSVVILGTARIVEDKGRKVEALKAVVNKYTPQLSHLEFPENMMRATGVIEITPVETTGKYFR